MGGMVGRALGMVRDRLEAAAIYAICLLVVAWDFVSQGWEAE